MTTLKQASWIAYRFGSLQCGYKTAARLAGIPRSAMRYGRMVWRLNLLGAVLKDVISDQRVVGILAKLPPGICATIKRIEIKLHRHLSRTRADTLVRLFFRIQNERLNRTSP